MGTKSNSRGGLSEEMAFELKFKARGQHSRQGNRMCKGPEVRKSTLGKWKNALYAGMESMAVRVGEVSR